ncbi:hypothetical protein AMTR_s00479p00009490 [Amborella trichopoda]|uniref:Uncharacterized protein n=1 Tax=Amborella trichopoda TaxID=13333 RepID=W1NQ06_AMBTC|nr:hypothetical protein AMTR_s00479p00009490 [Amborella trichopoda]
MVDLSTEANIPLHASEEGRHAMQHSGGDRAGWSKATVNHDRAEVWPIGRLLPLSLFSENGARERGGKPLGISAESCIAWLDTQPLHSVLYVSFGSQNAVSGGT